MHIKIINATTIPITRFLFSFLKKGSTPQAITANINGRSTIRYRGCHRHFIGKNQNRDKRD